MKYKKLPNDIGNIIGKENSIAGVNEFNQLVPNIQDKETWILKFIGYTGGEAETTISKWKIP